MMMWLLATLALVQGADTARASGPQVGDTLWITRVARIPPGGAVRPAVWAPTGDVELLGPPMVVPRGDSIEVRYPAVAWRPGSHTLEVPGPLLLLAGGGVDSLAPLRVSLTVASVLPPGVPDSALRPQPPADVVRRAERTSRPVILLGILAVLLVIPIHLRWRRRGQALAAAQRMVAAKALPVARWAGAGEGRAALAAANAALRDMIAARVPSAPATLETEACIAELRSARPDWPVDELRDLLHAIDAARFRPQELPEAADLANRALELRQRLTGAAA